MSFDLFRIHPKCLQLLKTQKITEPTAVQEQAIPVALEGGDIIAVAQTGTGKTLAFALPALTRLAEEKPRGNRMLVLAPTRELAQQVHQVIDQFGRSLGIRSTCIYGGAGMEPQTRALRRGSDVVIATPGRLLDHMRQGNVRFDALSILVLDEADRMLDMGFLPDIRRILSTLPKERQTLFFSATFPADISRLTTEFQQDPVRIRIAPQTTAAESVRQSVYTVEAAGKQRLLTLVLDKPGVDSALVFVRTKHGSDRLGRQLLKSGFKAEVIHGGRSQGQRQRALEDFKRGKFKILVATDVAARGIDVQGITHVVNFDIPKNFEDYVHRIGRTGRANASGDAITFVSPQDFKEFGAIERGLGSTIPQEEWDGSVRVLSLFNAASTSRAPARRGGGSFRKRPRGRFAAAR